MSRAILLREIQGLELILDAIHEHSITHIKAVLLESYHSGTLPTSLSGLKNFCENAKELGIPVYLTGNQDGFGYESKIEFDALGIKSLEMMSPIAAYIKLWLLDS